MSGTSPGKGRASELQRSIALATCILEEEIGHIEQTRRESDAQLQKQHEELIKVQEQLKQQNLREEAIVNQLRKHQDESRELNQLKNELDNGKRCLEARRIEYLEMVLKPDLDTALFLTKIVRDA